MKTLKLLKDYASTQENTWLYNQLEILEKEINSDITEVLNVFGIEITKDVKQD